MIYLKKKKFPWNMCMILGAQNFCYYRIAQCNLLFMPGILCMCASIIFPKKMRFCPSLTLSLSMSQHSKYDQTSENLNIPFGPSQLFSHATLEDMQPPFCLLEVNINWSTKARRTPDYFLYQFKNPSLMSSLLDYQQLKPCL